MKGGPSSGACRSRRASYQQRRHNQSITGPSEGVAAPASQGVPSRRRAERADSVARDVRALMADVAALRTSLATLARGMAGGYERAAGALVLRAVRS